MRRILTNKEIYASVKKRTMIEAIRLNRLRWFGHVQRMEENRIPKRVLYMNVGTTRLRGRPWNRWQDEVREDGRIVGGEGWQGKVHNREEWKKLLRTARNRCILHTPMEWMNEWIQQWETKQMGLKLTILDTMYQNDLNIALRVCPSTRSGYVTGVVCHPPLLLQFGFCQSQAHPLPWQQQLRPEQKITTSSLPPQHCV